MTPDAPPRSDGLPATIALPRLDDDAGVRIHEFLHQVLDLFEARYAEQIRRFYDDLGGADMPPGSSNVDDPPF